MFSQNIPFEFKFPLKFAGRTIRTLRGRCTLVVAGRWESPFIMDAQDIEFQFIEMHPDTLIVEHGYIAGKTKDDLPLEFAVRDWFVEGDGHDVALEAVADIARQGFIEDEQDRAADDWRDNRQSSAAAAE